MRKNVIRTSLRKATDLMDFTWHIPFHYPDQPVSISLSAAGMNGWSSPS
jgi:hypothetical protein